MLTPWVPQKKEKKTGRTSIYRTNRSRNLCHVLKLPILSESAKRGGPRKLRPHESDWNRFNRRVQKLFRWPSPIPAVCISPKPWPLPALNGRFLDQGELTKGNFPEIPHKFDVGHSYRTCSKKQRLITRPELPQAATAHFWDDGITRVIYVPLFGRNPLPVVSSPSVVFVGGVQGVPVMGRGCCFCQPT